MKSRPARPVRVGYRLVGSSSDIVVEADGPDPGRVLVELARAFTDVTTAGGRADARERVPIAVEAPGDLPRLAVAFVNELVYLFATRFFLPTDGHLAVQPRPEGGHRAWGELRGERFDAARHSLGTEVKAATYHEAAFEATAAGARARLLLDL